MSSRRERRPSVPPLRFRPQLEAPPQHAVAAPRVPSSVPSHVFLQSASAQSPPLLTPSRSELALMVPAARPAVQPSIVQHIHQQFIVSPCPIATARPVLPSEDLWSVEGLRSAASGQPSASRWRHGRSRTPLAPLAASVDPVGASPAVAAPSQSCHTGLLPSNDAQAAARRKRVAEALEFIASKKQAAAAPAPALATRAAARGGGHRSPAVQEALDFARALSARQATAALERARAEYEAGVARAALLRRAGRSLDAYELLQSLTPPPPPPAASLGSLAPILPASAPATSSVATVGTTALGALALADWHSLADSPFSHLPPGDAGALASPVHVITAGMDDLQPGARRARAKALVAAAKLVPFMTIEMLARFLGCPSSTLRDRDRSLVAADAIRIIGSGWSESLINGARTTWIRISRFAAASGRLPPNGGKYIIGYVVRDFLDEVDRCARRAYARRSVTCESDAKGSTARHGAASHLKFLANTLSFPIDVSSKAVQRAMTQSGRRSSPVAAPPLGIRMLCVLSWLTQHSGSPFVRGHAAAWLAIALFAMRFINAQRSRLVSVRDGVVYAVCDLDAKASQGSQMGRPMWTSQFDLLGSDAWITELMAMRDALPRASAADPHYFLRDTNSPDGDPSKASAWVDAPCPGGRRATRSLRALGALSPWALPSDVLARLTGHSPRHDLPNVSRAGGDTVADTNEVGRWSGSKAQLAPESAGDSALGGAPAPRLAMPERYSADAASCVVPTIMERQLRRLRAVVAAHGPASLPFEGGWSLVRALGDCSSSHEASAGTAPLLLTRTDGEDSAALGADHAASGTMGALGDVPHLVHGDPRAQVL